MYLAVVVVDDGVVGRCDVVVDVLDRAAARVVDVWDEVELFLLLTQAIPVTITTTASTVAVQNHHRLNTGFLPTGGGTRECGPPDSEVWPWRAC
jgi:hypothetical protein